MKNKIAVILVGLALAGCIGPRGGHYVGGDAAGAIFPPSASDADQVCRKNMELEFNPIYDPLSLETHGMPPGTPLDEQRNHFYQNCMANMGRPGATLEPSAPSS